MVRIGIVAAGLSILGALAANALELDCVPLPDPTGQGSDPVVKSLVKYEKGSWIVLHQLQSGTIIDRSTQYSLADTTAGANAAWHGVRTTMPHISMVGKIIVRNGTLLYEETVLNSKIGRAGNRTIGNICVARQDVSAPSSTLAQRRQEEIDRAAQSRAAAARIEAETKERAARAEKVALLQKAIDVIRAKLFDCIASQASSMVLTNETSEVVAKSAILLCNSDADAFARAVLEKVAAETGSSGSREQVDKLLQDLVTARIVKVRGDILKQQLDKPPPPPPIPNLPPT